MPVKIEKIKYIFLILLIGILSYFCADGLNTRDSGEFLSSAVNLDITHPPGNILYSISGKLFYLIGNIKAVNLMSVFYSALTFLIILKLFKKQNIIVLVICFLFFTGKNILYYSTTAEVYTLNLFLFSVLLYFFEKRIYSAVAFTYGLLALISPVNIILFFPFIIYSFYKCNDRKRFILLFLISLLFILYMPFRSLNNPPVDFGNTEKIQNLIEHYTGKNFKVKSNVLSFSIKVISDKIFLGIQLAYKKLETYIFLLALFLFYKKKKNKDLYAYYSFLFLYFILFLSLNLDLKYSMHFLLPFFLVCHIIMGKAFIDIRKIYIIPVILCFIIFNLYSNIPFHTNTAEEFAENTLRCIEKPAIVFISRDNRIFYFDYLKNVKKNIDKDIFFINMLNLKDSWFIDKFKEKYNIDGLKKDEIEKNFVKICEKLKEKYNIYSDIEPEYLDLNAPYYIQGLLFQSYKKSRRNSDIFESMSFDNSLIKLNDQDPELFNLIISYNKMFGIYEDLGFKNDKYKEFIKIWQKHYSYIF